MRCFVLFVSGRRPPYDKEQGDLYLYTIYKRYINKYNIRIRHTFLSPKPTG